MLGSTRNSRGRLRGARLFAVVCCALILAACTGSGSSRPTASSSEAGIASPTRTPAAGSVPNFVFVLTDDLSMNLISHMPQVQQMQREGTSLDNYYVVNSLCCPSRTAILTGEYPHNNGVLANIGRVGGYPAFQQNGDERKTFAVALHRDGYRTGFFGKYLNGYSSHSPVPPGWDDWGATAYGYQEFNYSLNVNGKATRFGDKPEDYLTDVISGMGDRFIAKSAAKHKPFMLELAPFAPHLPYVPAPRYAKVDPGVTYPRTAAFDRLPTNAPSWLSTGRRPLSAADIAGINRDYLQRVRADLAVDDLIANVRSSLAKAGVTRNTYLVFSSDNGYHMGEDQLLPGKQTAFDTDIKVPLIVTGPGVPGGHVSHQLASSIDLAPTFTSLAGAGAGPDADVDGVSLAPLWQGGTPADWQQGVFVEHHGPNRSPGDPDAASYRSGQPPSYDAVRTPDALYVEYSDGEREYYDTRTDPDELHNLAAQGIPPVLPSMLAALRTCRGQASCQAAARAG